LKLIICRYTEDLSWVKEIKEQCVVYDKLNNFQSNQNNLQIIQSKNYGREAHAIANYCFNNYDNLPELSIFCQGNPFVHCPDFLDRIKVNWEVPTCLSHYYKSGIPSGEVKEMDSIELRNNFKITLSRADAFGWNSNIPNGRNRQWCEQIWNLVFSCPVPEKIYFGYGSLWAVPKKNILNRSKEFWRWANKILEGPHGLSKTDNDPITPLNAWAWEILWNYIWKNPKIYTDYFS